MKAKEPGMKTKYPLGESRKLSPQQAKEISKLCEAYYRAPIERGGADTPQKRAARQPYAEKSAQLAKRLFGLTLTAEEAFRCVEYHQTLWTIRNPGTLAERIAVLNQAARTGQRYIGKEGEEISAADYFGRIFFRHDYTTGPRTVKTVECGGMVIADTPRCLYRLLFLTNPPMLDFSDMYKTGEMFALLSPDGQFAAHVELWKYELAIRFSAGPEHVTGRSSAIQCGIPGVDNGIQGHSPLLKAWQDCLRLCLNSKWDVYSGNNFAV